MLSQCKIEKRIGEEQKLDGFDELEVENENKDSFSDLKPYREKLMLSYGIPYWLFLFEKEDKSWPVYQAPKLKNTQAFDAAKFHKTHSKNQKKEKTTINEQINKRIQENLKRKVEGWLGFCGLVDTMPHLLEDAFLIFIAVKLYHKSQKHIGDSGSRERAELPVILPNYPDNEEMASRVSLRQVFTGLLVLEKLYVKHRAELTSQ